MKKILTMTTLAVLAVMAAVAQKPKDTFDHEKFGKKVVLYMNADITSMCAKDNDLQYVATTTGKSLDELKAQNETNKKVLKEDVDFLNKNGILRIYDKSELNVIQESPIKIANIILYCHYKDKNYTLTLTHCIQTNTTWVLGDGIDPKGDAIADLIAAKRVHDEKVAGSFLGKANTAAKEQMRKDSIERAAAAALRKTIKGYQATLFPMQGTDAYTQYVHTDLYNKSLPGYIIDAKGNRTNVDNIRYWEPYTLLIMGPTFGDLAAPPLIPVKDILTFYVGDQMFVQYLPGKWAILIGEGAIRRLVTIEKVNVANVEHIIVNNMIQKLGGNPENHLSLNLSFEKSMSEYVKENQELVAKITNHTEGYFMFNLDKIIIEYNKWYDKQFPDKVEYLPLGLEDPDDPADVLIMTSKDDLRKYLQNKRWEVATFTSYPENKMPQKIEGTDKVKAAQRYSTYDIFSNGTFYQFGNPSKWSVPDEKTLVLASNACSVEGITATTFRMMRKNPDGTKEKIKLRTLRSLTPKDLDRYDSIKNFRARALPTQFKGLAESRPDSVQMTREGGWVFSKMLKGTIDASDQFTFGKINGKPIHMSFMGNGFLGYTDGVWRANGITNSNWTYVKAADHNLELKFTYNPASKKKEAIEKYTLISVTSDELIYEDKLTKTRFVWKKEK